MTRAFMTRAFRIAGTVLVVVMTALFCLIPKPENDLFFILRIGTDILHSGRVPHIDTYSWTNYGTHWDLPEWLAFVCYALAFRGGGFFGTWLLMTGLTVAATLVVWRRLARCAGAAWAFGLVTVMLVASSGSLQERPYAFTYLLLAVSLEIVLTARETRLRHLLWLLPLCVLWANLHQGVLALLGLLGVYALGDAFSARRRAAIMAAVTVACAAATLISPYGWHLYTNVFITLRDPTLMANVTEWNSVLILPAVQIEPLAVLAIIAFGALALSQTRSLADTLAVAALFGQALLHARNIPLFVVGSLMIVAPHFDSAVKRIRRQLGLAPEPESHPYLLSAFALLFMAAVALVSVTSLRKAVGPRGHSLAGIGEAVARVPGYPDRACAFMDAEGFPSHLRLLNGFETGGYLLWRLPREPVFVDGRLDVYVGRTFDDMLTLTRSPGSPAWASLVQRYDFDCVLTTSGPEANAFASDPSWALVYTDPIMPHHKRTRILLRRRPQFAALIARCRRDSSKAER